VAFPNSSIQVADVSVGDAWRLLQTDPATVLVDVRTRAEWTYVGLPDLASIGKRPVLMELQSFPDNREDAQFGERLAGLLNEAGVAQSADIVFLCRSGVRSRRAAEIMTAAGFSRCHNIADGFEGPHDGSRHRGVVGGWKAAGLPWSQG
jgi:rhodanese-related sulfurtransferase